MHPNLRKFDDVTCPPTNHWIQVYSREDWVQLVWEAVIPLTLFGFRSMRDTWLEAKAVEEEKDYNNDADDGDFGTYTFSFCLNLVWGKPGVSHICGHWWLSPTAQVQCWSIRCCTVNVGLSSLNGTSSHTFGWSVFFLFLGISSLLSSLLSSSFSFSCSISVSSQSLLFFTTGRVDDDSHCMGSNQTCSALFARGVSTW